MNDCICEMTNVYKSYKKKLILQNINIQLEKGKIYGFIGKNGAGKTTTMKIIAGLSFADCGYIQIFGKDTKKEMERARRKIGCIIENPAFFPDMSAKENLKALCILYEIRDQKRIDDILELVGLENTGKKKVKNFSLGMRQRLGIGMALLNNPELLILDEPINGLDPDGIVEIRNLIKKINTEKKTTIIISSHILSEIYLMVDNYIIISQGKIIEQISQKELDEKCQKYICIKDSKTEIVKEVLRDKLQTNHFQIMEDGTCRLYDYTDNILTVMEAFKDTEININEICVKEDSLEAYFFNRIG